MLLEAQLVMGGLLQPNSSLNLTLEQGLIKGLIDTYTRQSLSELESTVYLVENTKTVEDPLQNVLPVSTAMEFGLIREEVGLRILELQIHSGGLRTSTGLIMSLEQAKDKRFLTQRILTKLWSILQHRELIDSNTAEKLNLRELQQRCVPDSDSGHLLFPVKQQPEGSVCIRSGKKVGIFRAVREGLIDQKVAVRLLEAQLFAGGIADPRSGHRLTVNEAVHHRLMDQDLACAMLARQLQNGGILDPFSGERLDLDESVHRDLISPLLALMVLEHLWAFMGILWSESGELLPIAEGLQQGVISGELSSNILRHRHVIGALYNPENFQVLPLNKNAEDILGSHTVSFLKDIHIPDFLPSINQSGIPSLDHLSWGSTCSTPPPSSLLLSPSPEGIAWHAMPTNDKEGDAKLKLLFHLMSHSYVDAHSGKRLVLLDSELDELVKVTVLCAKDSVGVNEVEQQSSLTTGGQGELKTVEQFSLTDERMNKQAEVDANDSSEITPSKEFGKNDIDNLEEKYDGKSDSRLLHKPSAIVGSDLAFAGRNEIDVDKTAKAEKKGIPNLEGLGTSGKNIESEFKNEPQLEEAECKHSCSNVQETRCANTVQLKSEKGFSLLKEAINLKAEMDAKMDTSLQTESETFKREVPVPLTSQMTTDTIESAGRTEQQDGEFARLVQELKQGGLLTPEGEKLLPDEAVAQGLLPGYMAVKLMAAASLFGGFIDASSGESLSLDSVMQEGLLDEDLMWRVLKSDKIISGIVDVDKKQICSIREAARAGLIDPSTAARLLEAQVVSGGIVDLHRDKKVSVTLAATLGLIDNDQREELMALERVYKGKSTDSVVSFTKASLQLQIEGIVEPESTFPVPLEQAIKKGLIKSEEAYQLLARQVAEGGVIHHTLGLRLSVSDAVDRGLVPRSIASSLEELEWVYQGKVSPSSHPEALILQASTGAILDPESGSKITLSEAVSKGLLGDSFADKVMSSPGGTRGMLDPQTASIVPFSELVNQGKIDIETGRRFLEVKQFKGIQDEKTRDKLSLSEAVASKIVDPIPTHRLFQSQADCGGIVDITTGEKLSLFMASEKGLIEDNMAREIAINQLWKGGLVEPVTAKQISILDDAIAKGLISAEIASAIQDKFASEEMESDNRNSSPVASSTGAYSPAVTLSVSDPDSPAHWSDVNTQVPSRSPLLKTVPLTATASHHSLLHDHDTTVEDKVEVPQPDQSMDLLCKFVTDVEKRIQLAKEKKVPQPDINKSDTLPKQKFDDRLQIVAESIHTDKDSLEGNSATVLKQNVQSEEVEEKECRARIESTLIGYHESDIGNVTGITAADAQDERENKFIKGSEVGCNRSNVETQDDVDEKAKEIEKQKPLKSDDEQPRPLLTSQSKVLQNKKKKNKKKNEKGQEIETQPTGNDQADAHIEEESRANVAVPDEPESQDKYDELQLNGQAAATLKGEKTTDRKEVDPAILEFTELTTEPEKDGLKILKIKDTDKYDKMEKVKKKKKKKQKKNVEKQPSDSQEAQKGRDQYLLQRSALPEEEKAALVLKAKESILKRVFEKGVTEKQTAKELKALRKDVVRKESQSSAVQDGRTQSLPDVVNGVEDPTIIDSSVSTPQTTVREHSKRDSDKGDIEPTVPSANERGQKSSRKEGIQKDIERVQSVRHKETLVPPEKVISEQEPRKITNAAKAKPGLDKYASGVDKCTDGHSASDVVGYLIVDEGSKISVIDAQGSESSQHYPPALHQSEETSSQTNVHIHLTGVPTTGEGQSLESLDKSIDLPLDAFTCKSDIPPKALKKEIRQQPQADGANAPDFKGQNQNPDSSKSAEDALTECESPNIPESNTITECWEEAEDDIEEMQEIVSNKDKTRSKTRRVTSY